MQVEQLITEFAKLANLAENEVNDLYKVETDDEGNEVKKIEDVSKAIEVVKTGIANKFSDIQKNHYGRGLKEGASKFESYIKTQFQSEKQGTELLEDYLSHLETRTSKAKLTADEIKNNPLYKDLVNSEVKALKEEAERVKQELNAEKSRYYQEKLTDRARNDALKVLDKIRWAKSDDPEQAEKQKTAIYRLIDYSKLKLDNNQLVLMDDQGETLKDQYHNPVSFESYIESINPFGVHKVNPNQKAPQTNGVQVSGTTLKIRSQAEYDEYIRKYPKDRLNAMKAFRNHLEGV